MLFELHLWPLLRGTGQGLPGKPAVYSLQSNTLTYVNDQECMVLLSLVWQQPCMPTARKLTHVPNQGIRDLQRDLQLSNPSKPACSHVLCWHMRIRSTWNSPLFVFQRPLSYHQFCYGCTVTTVQSTVTETSRDRHETRRLQPLASQRERARGVSRSLAWSATVFSSEMCF